MLHYICIFGIIIGVILIIYNICKCINIIFYIFTNEEYKYKWEKKGDKWIKVYN